MKGVIVEFQYEDSFDPGRIAAIAREARGRFEGMPGLRLKAFTVDEANRRATNVYLWESEDAARGFFDDALIERVTASTACGRPSRSSRSPNSSTTGSQGAWRSAAPASSQPPILPLREAAIQMIASRVAKIEVPEMISGTSSPSRLK